MTTPAPTPSVPGDSGESKPPVASTDLLTRAPFLRSGMTAALGVVAALFVVLLIPLWLWPLVREGVGGIQGFVAYHGGLWLVFLGVWIGLHYRVAADTRESLARRQLQILPFRMQWRTGVAGRDILCLLAGLVAAAVAIGTGHHPWAPAPLMLAVGTVALMRSFPNQVWELLGDQRPIEVPDPLPPEPVSDGVRRVLEWDYAPLARAAFQNRVEVVISAGRIEALRAANPTAGAFPGDPASVRAIVNLLVNGALTREMREVARYLLVTARDQGLSVYEEIDNALRMVQANITYRSDSETAGKEYWRFPLETIHDLVGDCDCKSILAAGIFKLIFRLQPGASSRDVVLLLSDKEAHMALAVEGPADLPGRFFRADRRCYYYCESTAEGMRVGEVPPSVDVRNYDVVHLDDTDPGEWAIPTP